MNQQTFTDIEYSMRKRTTKREEFLKKMEEIIPWSEWISIIEPYYPKGGRGRPTRGIELMLRMYLLQSWFHLSDEGVEDAIYDSYAMRCFTGINFAEEQVPDATTLLKFRHLLEAHNIGERLFKHIRGSLESSGLMMRGGTIVDATIISAPSSTKNKEGHRDPEMHQTKKGNQWYFGIKSHLGVDAGSGYIHSFEVTSANVHDIKAANKLIRPDDAVVYGDAGYIGLDKREEIVQDENLSVIEYRINRRRNSLQAISEGFLDAERDVERRKSSVRSKVEHPFLILKRYFGYCKTVYRGISKNKHHIGVLLTCVNLLMCARANRTLKPLLLTSL
jgi:IS5 family transposase